MPVISDINVEPEKREILRRLGIKGNATPHARVLAAVDEILDEVIRSKLLQPRLVFEIYPIKDAAKENLILEDDVTFHGSLISSRFAQAKELAVVVCTIGAILEEKTAAYFSQKKQLYGLILDAIGSSAIDCLRRQSHQLMSTEADARGYVASSPIGPGIATFPMNEQFTLFSLVDAGKIGVSLTSAAMMSPKKSLSMIFGFGVKMPVCTDDERCRKCSRDGKCDFSYPESKSETKG